MTDPLQDRLIALAGLYQASVLVAQTARTGMVDTEPFTASIDSIFALNAETVADIYGGPGGVSLGIAELERALRSPPGRSREALNYAVAVLHLERKLARSKERMASLRQSLEDAGAAREQFGVTHPNVLARLAQVYSEQISVVGPKVMVRGEPALLEQPALVNRVRALLLAAVRAAVLWRQIGGTRLGLLLQRRRYLERLRELSGTTDSP